MIKSRSLGRSVSVVGFFTFISRIFGLIRDMVFANIFGSGLVADAFFVAFRIPNLLRKLFAEGSLTIAFIPVFSEYLLNKGQKRAFELANSVLNLLVLTVCLVTIIGIVFSPFIVTISAYGFNVDPQKFDLTVALTRVMFPYIVLISVVAFYMGVLNTFGHFGAPSAAPILLNLMIIISAYVISPLFDRPIFGVAVGVLLGGVAQVALQVPFARRTGFRHGLHLNTRDEGLRKIGRLFVPTIFGSAIYQLNQVIGTLLASFLQEGSVSWLYYADRLVQFPLGVFGVAMGTVSLASLSRHAAEDDLEAYKRLLGQAMRLLVFISVPATFGLVVLGEPIVALFFERGRFSHEDTIMTTRVLWAYGIGLLAFSQLRVLVSGFFALKDTKTPVYVASFALLANFLFGIILMGPLGPSGLALALSIASILQALALYYLLKRRLGIRDNLSIEGALLKAFSCSVLMTVLLIPLMKLLSLHGPVSLVSAIKLFVLVIVGAFLYILFAYFMKTEELKHIRL